MAESCYLRYPHLAHDLITFTAEDDAWLALQALEERTLAAPPAV